jgi:hypothetical protein
VADYEDLAAARDVEVDDRLGNRVFYHAKGTPGPVPLKGFDKSDVAPEGYGARDPAKGIKRMKIAKALVPEVSIDDRITASWLDGTYRPVAPDTDPVSPAYWLVDLQKVS